MKKFLYAATAAVAAVAMSPAAQATGYVFTLSGSPLTGSFGATVNGLATGYSFTDTFTFTAPAGLSTSGLQTVALGGVGVPGDIDFTSVLLDGVAVYSLSNGFFSYAGLSPSLIGPGSHVITVKGTAYGSASYSGTFNLIPTVPEPATWAMMVAGIAAVGTAMRRRANNVRVAFS